MPTRTYKPIEINPAKAGRAAKQCGRPRWECPFGDDTEKQAWWLVGYDAADVDPTLADVLARARGLRP